MNTFEVKHDRGDNLCGGQGHNKIGGAHLGLHHMAIAIHTL